MTQSVFEREIVITDPEGIAMLKADLAASDARLLNKQPPPNPGTVHPGPAKPPKRRWK